MTNSEIETALRTANAELAEKVNELQQLVAALQAELGERRAAERALADSHEAMKDFASAIAHDFRTPMVNLKGFSRELAMDLAEVGRLLHDGTLAPAAKAARVDALLEGDIAESLSYIQSAVDRLDRAVIALLKLTRLGRRETTRAETDLGELVGSLLQSLAPQIAARDIQVSVGPLPKLFTDQVALEQIFGNLLDNAVKYLDPGRRGEIAVACDRTGDEMVFSVADNGRGIAGEDQKKIFEVFFRAGAQDVPGDGMGLAYVKSLVGQLGGRIWCQSAPGAGTRMLFTLPQSANKP